jgi:hypothetical protein
VKRESVGSFLYGTAYRVALEARARNIRRARERQVPHLPHPAAAPAEPQDWRPLLDEELNRLPERYRAAVVLCELEGRSRREAARHLGVPEGTLSSRLAAARRLLADRLTRRGLGLSGGAVAALSGGEAQAAVPAVLAASAVRAATRVAAGQATGATAAALTKGACKAMFMSKLQSVVAASLLATVVGVGAWTVGAGGQEPGLKAAPVADARDDKEAALLREENARLQRELKKVQERLAALEEKLAAEDLLRRQAEQEKLRRDALERLAHTAEFRLAEPQALLERLTRAQVTQDQTADKAKLLNEALRQLAEEQARINALFERVTALQEELAQARGRQEDPAAAAEAALKEFRAAKDKETQRRAADALEKAVKKLKEQLK